MSGTKSLKEIRDSLMLQKTTLDNLYRVRGSIIEGLAEINIRINTDIENGFKDRGLLPFIRLEQEQVKATKLRLSSDLVELLRQINVIEDEYNDGRLKLAELSGWSEVKGTQLFLWKRRDDEVPETAVENSEVPV